MCAYGIVFQMCSLARRYRLALIFIVYSFSLATATATATVFEPTAFFQRHQLNVWFKLESERQSKDLRRVFFVSCCCSVLRAFSNKSALFTVCFRIELLVSDFRFENVSHNSHGADHLKMVDEYVDGITEWKCLRDKLVGRSLSRFGEQQCDFIFGFGAPEPNDNGAFFMVRSSFSENS